MQVNVSSLIPYQRYEFRWKWSICENVFVWTASKTPQFDKCSPHGWPGQLDLHLNQLHICHYYNQKKCWVRNNVQNSFRIYFFNRSILRKGYRWRLPRTQNIREHSWKLHKNEGTYPKKFLSYQTNFISAKYFTFAIRTVSYGPSLYDLRDPNDRLVSFLLNWTWTANKISYCSFEWLNHFIFMAAFQPRSER